MKAFLIALALLPITALFNNCSMGSPALNLGASMDSTSSDLSDGANAAGKALYEMNCAGCHGPIDSSTKTNRTSALILDAIQNIPQMQFLSNISDQDIQLIAAALSPSIDTVIADGRTFFTCEPSQIPRTPSYRLSNREYRDALNFILDGFAPSLKQDSALQGLINSVPTDVVVQHGANKEQPVLLNQQMVTGFFEASFRAGALVAANNTGLQNYPNTNGCLGAGTITQACHRTFARELGSKAFRRILSSAEGNSLSNTFWDASLSKAQLIQLTVSGILTSPDFMYKVYDRGSPSNRGGNTLSLTAFELASKVSFFLTGLPPDAQLISLAQSGQLLNNTTLSQQVDRLLQLPGAQQQVVRMFREAYGYDNFDSFNYSTAFLSGLNTGGLREAMTAELDEYFVEVVLRSNGNFEDFMTDRRANITNANLAAVHGLGSATGPVSLSASRSGFLNRPGFLAKRSGTTTSPVKRGLRVLNSVLCDDVGSPPPDAPTQVISQPQNGGYLTTRERYVATSEQAGTSCLHCHSRINNLGYTFEKFDSIGRERTHERIFVANIAGIAASLPVNTSVSTSEVAPNQTVNLSDSADLVQSLSRSDKAMMCLVRNIKEFEGRRSISSEDNCQMNNALSTIYGSAEAAPGTIKDVIKAMILSEDFRLWSY